MTFEDILARDGKLVYKTRGVSMEPMLRQNRDLVVIRENMMWRSINGEIIMSCTGWWASGTAII